ncbi:MAG: stage sporulation protein [Clostridiales bacterium]|nr:stage sporulation protein [Clostridiales bacterium]
MVIQWLKSWISAIVSIVLITTFMEIVLPDSQVRKYIQFIIGIVIMLTILSPVITLLGHGDELINDINNISFDMQRADLKQSQQMVQEQQSKSAIELYKKRLQQGIKQQVDALGYGETAKVDIAVDEDEDSETFGSIQSMHIYVKQEKDGIEPVEPVNIDISGKPEETVQAVSAPYAQNIKTTLATYYQISPDDIAVSAISDLP